MFSEVANAPAKLLKEYKEEIPALKAAYAEEMCIRDSCKRTKS